MLFETLAAATKPEPTFEPIVHKHGKQTVTIDKGKRFPFAVLCILDRPKARYRTHKILFHYGFKSLEEAVQHAETYIKGLKEKEDAKAADALKRKSLNAELKASDYFKIGDIILNTWGWEQTNVDFYKVTEVLNKKIRVVAIGQREVEGTQGNMSCDVMPVPEVELSGSEKNNRLLSLKVESNGKVFICNPASYFYFHKWDGRQQYKSWYA